MSEDKEQGELVREGKIMLPNGNGVHTKVYRGPAPKPKNTKKAQTK